MSGIPALLGGLGLVALCFGLLSAVLALFQPVTDLSWVIGNLAVGVLLVRLPVAYVCGIVLEGGLFGAWLGMCADMALRAVLATIWFTRGRWVQQEV